jgi:hypothetical protein
VRGQPVQGPVARQKHVGHAVGANVLHQEVARLKVLVS